MLYKYIPPKDAAPEDLLNVDLINADKIVEVTENLTTDLQDWDVKLASGLEVIIYKENCFGEVPEVGDYFYIQHNPFKILWKAAEFEPIFKPIPVEEAFDGR